MNETVLVHQLLAMTLQFGAVSAERCWTELHVVSDFGGITRPELDALVAHMLKEDYLFESGGLLSMGSVAERVFGKKNFLELYAVFSSPVLFRVQNRNGKDLGSLEQNFVDRLVEEVSSFLLGGRAWTVEHVNHSDRTVRVREAPRGQKRSWGGFIPQMLGFELCQRMRRVLVGTESYPYVDPMVARLLEDRRAELRPLLERTGPGAIQMDEDAARWDVRRRPHHTLKYGLEWVGSWKVVADNFQVRVEGDGE